MKKLYLPIDASGERINIDVYPPVVPVQSGGFASQRRPAIIVACGGAGKDLRLGIRSLANLPLVTMTSASGSPVLAFGR
jgi:hypothetical protein